MGGLRGDSLRWTSPAWPEPWGRQAVVRGDAHPLRNRKFARLSAGGEWIRTISSAPDGQRFRCFVRDRAERPWAVESAEYLLASAVRLICHTEIRRAGAHRRMSGATRAASTVDSVESLRIDRRGIRRHERRPE